MVPVGPHPYQHLFSIFLKIAILEGVEWSLIMVLICISLMSDNVEHRFMCLYLLSEKCLSSLSMFSWFC